MGRCAVALSAKRVAQPDVAAEVCTAGEIAVSTPANKGNGGWLVVSGAD